MDIAENRLVLKDLGIPQLSQNIIVLVWIQSIRPKE